jgi:hypothetical protein
MSSYQPYIHRTQGSTELTVEDGGRIAVESGGTLDIESGGILSLNSVTLTATAAELNLNDNEPASVSWTIASSSSYSQGITAQLKDAAGTAMAGNQYVKLFLFADGGPAAFVTPTSAMTMTTGNSAATCKLLVGSTSTPQYSMYGLTSTSGELSLKWSDTGKTATYIGLVMPGGRFGISTAAITTTSS